MLVTNKRVATPWLTHYQHAERFLLEHASLWQPAPFHQLPAWTTTHPALYNALLTLSDDALDRLEHNPHALLHWLHPHLPSLERATVLTRLPPATGALQKPWPTGFEWEIPGRKWAQIEAFTAALQPHAPTIIDWCAGKGHLGRSLAFQHENAVVALEWNQALCNAAALLNTKLFSTQWFDTKRFNAKGQPPITCHLQDVLADDAGRHLDNACHCVALHACGKLHLRLMSLATEKGVSALSFSPCCYHLIDTAVYTPLTTLDHTLFPQRLTPDRDQLRLAMQETVTANGHARRLRDRKSAWRLGFRQLVTTMTQGKILHGMEATLPSLPDRYFHGNFATFCTHAAAQRGGVLESGFDFDSLDFDSFETAGEQAHARIKRLELVRHAFRRVLEVWLCLDRACWLESQGFEVNVSEFCAATITPRNILIEAVKPNLAGQPAKAANLSYTVLDAVEIFCLRQHQDR